MGVCSFKGSKRCPPCWVLSCSFPRNVLVVADLHSALKITLLETILNVYFSHYKNVHACFCENILEYMEMLEKIQIILAIRYVNLMHIWKFTYIKNILIHMNMYMYIYISKCIQMHTWIYNYYHFQYNF